MIDRNTDKAVHRARCRDLCGLDYLSKARFLRLLGLGKNTRLNVKAQPVGCRYSVDDLADALYDLRHPAARRSG